MRPRRLLRLVPVTLLALGCATVRVNTDYDPEADFSRMHTFAWLEPPMREQPSETAEASDPFARNTLLDKRVRAAVEDALTRRGYVPADGAPPDFLLRYQLVLRDRTVSQPVLVDAGYRRYPYTYNGYYGTYTYEEGTLVLDVIDPATKQIAWRGWGRGRTSDAHLDAEEVKTYVDRILARFPPGAADAPAAAEEG